MALRRTLVRMVLLAALGAALFAIPAVASAEPVERQVGPYLLTLQLRSEPPYFEEQNALLLEVVDSRTGAPVRGLERSIRVEAVISVDIVSRDSVVDFRPVEGRPGRYESEFIAPALGDYTFRYVGTIDGTPLDETFRTGEEGLPAVVTRDGWEFGSQGVILAIAILIAYLVGMGVLAYVLHQRKRARRAAPAQPN